MFFCNYREKLVTVQNHLAVLEHLLVWGCILYTTLNNEKMNYRDQLVVIGKFDYLEKHSTQVVSAKLNSGKIITPQTYG